MPARRAAAAIRVNAVIFPYDPVHQTFINVYENDELRHQVILDYGRASADYYAGTLARNDGGARRVHPGGHSSTS